MGQKLKPVGEQISSLHPQKQTSGSVGRDVRFGLKGRHPARASSQSMIMVYRFGVNCCDRASSRAALIS